MVDWILLLVLLPLVIVPAVLLYGFAGCGSFLGADDPIAPSLVEPPSNLVAIATGTDTIVLTWSHPSAGGVTFVISQLGPSGVWNENFQSVTNALTVQTTGLEADTLFGYRVRAVFNAQESDWSNLALARTFVWRTVYDNPLNDDGNPFAGACLVQRIPKELLVYDGFARQVRLTLRCSPATTQAPFVVTSLSLSNAALAGDPGNPTPNPFDSASTPVLAGPVSLPGNGTQLKLPPVDLVLDKNRDLLVAFDVSATNTTETARTVANVGTSALYRRNNAQEAAVTNRSGNYTLTANTIHLIDKIEVLTGPLAP